MYIIDKKKRQCTFQFLYPLLYNRDSTLPETDDLSIWKSLLDFGFGYFHAYTEDE